MAADDSVTDWISHLRQGSESRAQQLWERFYRRLVGLARAHLRETPRRAADEEDVVVRAFDSFFRGVGHGRFPNLNDRHDLWRVLAMLTERKAIDQRRRHFTDKRGGGRVGGESVFERAEGDSSVPRGIASVVDGQPTPAFAQESIEELRRALSSLQDRALEQLALLKLEGYTNAEIAGQMKVTPRTVERRLTLIRRIWEES